MGSIVVGHAGWANSRILCGSKGWRDADGESNSKNRDDHFELSEQVHLMGFCVLNNQEFRVLTDYNIIRGPLSLVMTVTFWKETQRSLSAFQNSSNHFILSHSLDHESKYICIYITMQQYVPDGIITNLRKKLYLLMSQSCVSSCAIFSFALIERMAYVNVFQVICNLAVVDCLST